MGDCSIRHSIWHAFVYLMWGNMVDENGVVFLINIVFKSGLIGLSCVFGLFMGMLGLELASSWGWLKLLLGTSPHSQLCYYLSLLGP